jgi:hypothetical protein
MVIRIVGPTAPDEVQQAFRRKVGRIGRVEGFASFGKIGPWQGNEVIQGGLDAGPSPVDGPVVCDFSERCWHEAPLIDSILDCILNLSLAYRD